MSTEGRGDLGRRVQEVRSPQKVHNGEARAVEAVRDLTFERGEGEPGRPVGPFGCHRGARKGVVSAVEASSASKAHLGGGPGPHAQAVGEVAYPALVREEGAPSRPFSAPVGSAGPRRGPKGGLREAPAATPVCAVSPRTAPARRASARSTPGPSRPPRVRATTAPTVPVSEGKPPTGMVGAKTPQQSQEHLHAQGGREGSSGRSGLPRRRFCGAHSRCGGSGRPDRAGRTPCPMCSTGAMSGSRCGRAGARFRVGWYVPGSRRPG